MLSADPVTLPPAALGEFKSYLRLEGNAEDVLLAGLLKAAVELCEGFTQRVLLLRAHRETLDAGGAWQRLGAGPVAAVTVVEEAADGAPLPIDAYEIDIDPDGDGWVRIARGPMRVRVRYSAGSAADWTALPEALRQGTLRLAAHLHAARGGEPGTPPAAVSALWRPFRRLPFATGRARCRAY